MHVILKVQSARIGRPCGLASGDCGMVKHELWTEGQSHNELEERNCDRGEERDKQKETGGLGPLRICN